MPSVGDMVAYLDADTQRFNAAMKQAQREAKIMGIEIKNAVSGGPGGGAGGGFLAKNATGIGYMIQDFSAVLQNGGGLGRAIGAITNNVQAMGQGMSKWGQAAFAVGGALAGIVIPLMLNSSKSTDEFAKAQERAQQATDALVDALKRQSQMALEIRQLESGGTREQAEKAADARKRELEDIQKEIKVRADAIKMGLTRQLGQDESKGAFGGDLMKSWIGWFQGEPVDQGKLAAQRRDEAIKRLEKNGPAGLFDESGRLQKAMMPTFDDPAVDSQFQKLMHQLATLQDREKELEQQGKKIVSAFADNKEWEKINKEWDKQNAKAVEADKLRSSVRAPQEKYASEVANIRELLKGGEIDIGTAQRAMYGARQQLPQVKMTQEAAVYGSSAALSAITKAQVDSQRVQEQKSLERQLLDKATDQVRLLEQIADQKTVELSPVVIPP